MFLFRNVRRLLVRYRWFLVAALVSVVSIFLMTITFPSAVATGGRGDTACDRNIHRRLEEDDVISEKFMKDHICLIRKDRPKNLEAFCSDFRHGQPVYQVMLLTRDDIKRLRKDLMRHQQDFYSDREKFRQKPSSVHYTTDDTYSFIDCKYARKWEGKLISNKYMQYIPRGTSGKPEGIYKIYHGCQPVQEYLGFRQPGWC